MKIVTSFPHRVRKLENVWIPMRDGTRLAARIWLPEGAERSPVPAILEYIPYRKRDMTARRDALNHPYFAGHGYASVRVDIRGSGDSEGLLTDEYLEEEMADGCQVLRWLADQPWCTGSVGMLGISWGGFSALQLAARRPPELKAVIAACATDDRYADDVHYMGGCLLGDNLSWAASMYAHTSSPPDPLLVGDRWREMWRRRMEGSGVWLVEWLRHQRRDEYWRHGSVCENYSAITCPVLTLSGWADGYSNAVLRLLANLRCPRMGLIGPWGHKYPHLGIPGPAIGFLQECLRWWERWLLGVDNGIMTEPMLRVWMQESVPPTQTYETRPGRWVGEPCWPSPNVELRALRLGSRRLVPEEQAVQRRRPRTLSVQSPLSVGLFAGKWCSFTATPDLPHDQREEDGGSLIFDSPHLEERIELLGAPVVELELSSSRPVAMIAARLSDVAPDDKATRITYGVLNLTHHRSREDPALLEPGKRYRVEIQLNDVAQAVPSRHRLRLSLSTSYFPVVWPPPESARLTLYTRVSSLYLPCRGPRPEDQRLRPFDEPESAPPLSTTLIAAPEYRWTVIRDLARDESALEVVKDEGTYRIDDIELEIRSRTFERYTYRHDDFESVRGEAHTLRGFRRGSWAVSTATKTVLTCTRSHFHVHADLDAHEGDRRIYCSVLDQSIERDHL